MIDTMTVGKSIACLRKQKQMTQQGLAAAVNVSHQAVSKWENGAALPDMQTMLALSRMFGVSMENLLTGALLEAEEPVQEEAMPEKPAIELKLDSGTLNMNIVAEADDVIARAMAYVGPETEEEEPAAEPSPAEPKAPEAPQGTVNVDMNFDEIVRMAPFVGREVLETMLCSCAGCYDMEDLVAVAPFVSRDMLDRMLANCGMDWEALRRLAPFLGRNTLRNVIITHVEDATIERLRRLAPFLSRDALAEILAKMPADNDFTALKRLTPFMSRDTLYAELKRRAQHMTIDDLLSFAPYLAKDALGEMVAGSEETITRDQMIRLAKFLPRDQMDRLVYRAMGMKPPLKKGVEWDVTAELGRAYHEIKGAVHSGMQEARDAIKSVGLGEMMDGLNGAMKDMGGHINELINTWNQPTRGASRSQRIRTRIAEKALVEGNWDWIAAHVNELSADQIKQVLMKCAAADHEELIAQHLHRVKLTSAEACRLAQTVIDEDLWEQLLAMMEQDHAQRVLDYIGRTNPDMLARFGKYAPKEPDYRQILAEASSGNFDNVEMMEMEHQLKLVELVLKEDPDTIYKMVSSLHFKILPRVLDMMLDAECIYDLSGIAQCAQESDLPAMVLKVAQRGHWSLIDEMLYAIDDVDLSAVWPLAIEQADMADVIAMHGDANTLRGMTLALAEQGRFGEMDSFLEELPAEMLEAVLEHAMEKSDWDAIEQISQLLED